MAQPFYNDILHSGDNPMEEVKMESNEDALDFIDHLDEMEEDQFVFQRTVVCREENRKQQIKTEPMEHSDNYYIDNSSVKSLHMRSSDNSCEVKRPKSVEIDSVKSKERKRNNRINANRNDYGNEGFLLMIFYYLGCCISLSKLQKDGHFQKLRITEIVYENKVLLNRKQIEDEINKIQLPNDSKMKRDKNIITSIMTDNTLLDILKNFFGFKFVEDVKKKPEKTYMPERRILEHIEFDKSYAKKDIVDEGVKFYDNLKEYGKRGKMIFLSKNYVERCWSEGISVESPIDKNDVLKNYGEVQIETQVEIKKEIEVLK